MIPELVIALAALRGTPVQFLFPEVYGDLLASAVLGDADEWTRASLTFRTQAVHQAYAAVQSPSSALLQEMISALCRRDPDQMRLGFIRAHLGYSRAVGEA